MSASYKTTGLILRRIDYRDYDRMYTILTPERKVSALAKGVRKPTAKLSSQLELFADIDFMFVAGKGKSGVDIVTSARMKQWHDFTADYDRLRRGFLFLEMADKLTDTEGTGEVYDVLKTALDDLRRYEPALAELSFKLRLLDILGHAPDISTPSAKSQEYSFDVDHGVLISRSELGGASMSQDEIKLWRLLLTQPLDTVSRIRGVDEAAYKSLPLCDRFIDQQFSIRFRSTEI